MNTFYAGENLPDNDVWPGSQVKYLSEVERQAFEIRIHNGKLYRADGSPLDTSDASNVFLGAGSAIFVMDENGTFYASKQQKVGEFHHSSLLAGKPVAAAGEIGVITGELMLLSDRSGHYRPSQEFTRQALGALAGAGVDLSNVNMLLTVK